MARLSETPWVLEGIREKAYRNAFLHKTYGRRAIFAEGQTITNFEEQCNSLRRMRLEYEADEQTSNLSS